MCFCSKPTQLPDQKEPKSDLEVLHDELKAEASVHRNTGVVLGLLAFLLLEAIFYVVNFDFVPKEACLISNGKLEIDWCNVANAKSTHDPWPLVTYFLGHALIFGSFLTAIFYLIFRMAFGSFDQAARTTKRMHSAIFLRFLFDADKTGNKISIKEKMEFFRTWNETVESAFSNVKVKDQSMLEEFMSRIKSVEGGVSDIKGKVEMLEKKP